MKGTVKKPVDKLTPVNVNIGVQREHVTLVFDNSISRLEMTPSIAIQVAEKMKEKAIEILRSEPTNDEETMVDEPDFY